jgi:hypothetical protein
MSYPYRIANELESDASLAQVRAAIATGPGIDSCFIGHSDVESQEGGNVSFSLGGYTTVGTVTTWEPLKRLSHRSAESLDGSRIAFDYLIEGRDGGTTMLRIVQSGALDDNWEAEYDALDRGRNVHLHTIGE